MFRYMCGELQFLVGHRQCYLPSHALLQVRRCYVACRVSSRLFMPLLDHEKRQEKCCTLGDECLYGGGSMGKGACAKGGCFQVTGVGRQGTVRMAVVIEEGERQIQRETERHRETARDTERQRHTEIETERKSTREKETQTDTCEHMAA